MIVSAARALAEAEGWNAVTTRRLAAEIEYSQPVLYKHFTSMEQIADAVALDGYAELAEILDAVGDSSGQAAVTHTAYAYHEFARDHAAVYEAMFMRTTALRFGAADSPPPLTAAFAALRQVAGRVAAEGEDLDSLTELFWACLHGMATLGLTGRLRDDHLAHRVQLLAERLVASPRA